MIVVTGATGGLGGATVEHLLQRLPAERVGVSVRDPRRAAHLADRGVRVRRGSYEEPASLRESFEGADQVLLVSGNDPTADLVELHGNAIEAAVAAGVQRVIYTGQHAATPDNPYPPSQIHVATEAMLADSGLAWTSLRNAAYGPLDAVLGPWPRTGEVAQPADGPVPYTDRADIAEATAAVLASEHHRDGPLTLTAPTAVTLGDLAEIASALTGRTVERVVVDDEQWIADQVAHGTPPEAAEFMLTWYRATRAGHFAHTDPLLPELLGRHPRTVAERLAEAIAA